MPIPAISRPREAYVLGDGRAVHVDLQGGRLVERDPQQGLGFLVLDLAPPAFHREVVQLPVLLRAMKERADVRDAFGDHPQLFVELTPERVLEPLARVDVSSRQRDGSRSEPASGFSLLCQDLTIPDEHEHDTVQRRLAVTPSGRAAPGRHWLTAACSVGGIPWRPALPRPSRVASAVAAVMISMVTIASAATGPSAPALTDSRALAARR